MRDGWFANQIYQAEPRGVARLARFLGVRLPPTHACRCDECRYHLASLVDKRLRRPLSPAPLDEGLRQELRCGT